MSTQEIHRGDIYYANLDQGNRPGVQQGTRPVCVVSNDVCNKFSPAVTVVPMTTKVHQPMPTHVCVPPGGTTALPRTSILKAENITAISKDQLLEYKGRLPDHLMTALDEAVKVQLDIGST